jgi:uncharacterized membrane-anchored protein
MELHYRGWSLEVLPPQADGDWFASAGKGDDTGYIRSDGVSLKDATDAFNWLRCQVDIANEEKHHELPEGP